MTDMAKLERLLTQGNGALAAIQATESGCTIVQDKIFRTTAHLLEHITWKTGLEIVPKFLVYFAQASSLP